MFYGQTKTKHVLENKYKNKLQIWLTKFDQKDCDKVIITSYNPNGNIQESTFSFRYFNYSIEHYYEINIEYIPEKSGFFRFKKCLAYWKLDIIKLGDTNILTYEINEGTEESQELEDILENGEKSIRENIIDLIKNFKYTRVVLSEENMHINMIGG